MARIFIYKQLNVGDKITISGDDAHHIARVMRYKTKDILQISDGRSIESIVSIEKIDRKTPCVIGKVIRQDKKTEILPKISLFQGIPKKDKMDFILQKATEIGVCKFVPIITERTVVELTEKKKSHRQKRWEKIILEASKQCMRMDIPQICDIITFDKALEIIKDYNISFIPWEKEHKSLKMALMYHKNLQGSNIAVFIGPEGGFSQKEIKKAVEAEVVPVSLGPRILRTETAGLVACSLILYELGDLGGLR